MIRTFRSKALKRLWNDADPRGIDHRDSVRILMILEILNAAARPQDLDLPTLRFHELKGDKRGTYSVTVRANWRITFAWDADDAIRVDYEDYH